MVIWVRHHQSLLLLQLHGLILRRLLFWLLDCRLWLRTHFCFGSCQLANIWLCRCFGAFKEGKDVKPVRLVGCHLLHADILQCALVHDVNKLNASIDIDNELPILRDHKVVIQSLEAPFRISVLLDELLDLS